jgi:glycosyltransferase involved in cell wall biosynthesis
MKLALFQPAPAESAACAGLAYALAQNGATSIDLLSLRGQPAETAFVLPPQARRVELPAAGTLGMIRQLGRHLRAAQPDVLIAGPSGALPAALAARLGLARWSGRLLLRHGPALPGRNGSLALPPAARLLYRWADGVLTTSPALRERLIGRAGLDEAKVACLPCAVAPERAATASPALGRFLARAQRGLLLVTVARLAPDPALLDLLAAFTKVAVQRDAHLLLIGPDVQAAGLRRRVRALGLDERIELLDHAPSLAPYLRAADVFLAGAEADGADHALCEALRAGLPVIGLDGPDGRVRFMLADGRAGLLLPASADVDILAGAMAQMAVAQIRARYAGLARERAGAFMPRRVGAELIAFIEQLGRERAPGLPAARRSFQTGA